VAALRKGKEYERCPYNSLMHMPVYSVFHIVSGNKAKELCTYMHRSDDKLKNI